MKLEVISSDETNIMQEGDEWVVDIAPEVWRLMGNEG
jgi:hypothetical protein